MRFFDKIIRLFTGSDYDHVIRKLDSRIIELRDGQRTANNELEQLETIKINAPSFELHFSSAPPTKVEVKSFEPPKPKKIRTMKDLMEERQKEAAERRKQLKQLVAKNYDTIKSLILCEDPDTAEEILFETSPALQELNDEQLNNLYSDIPEDIHVLREELRQKEIKRLEEESKRKAEEEEKRIEQERLRKLREEQERHERERKAREYEEELAKEEERRSLEMERLTSLVTKRKDDGDMILEYLEMKGVKRFYHFTDKEKWYQIKKLGGLYSWYYCEQNDIHIPNAGGDSDSRRYDKRHGLQDYVRLSFCNDHPMAYRKHKEGATLYLLYIDIEVAAFKDTLFTDRNAASSSFYKGGDMEAVKKININATQRNFVSRDEGEIFSLHQAECMIKTFLPSKYITNINNPKIMYFG